MSNDVRLEVMQALTVIIEQAKERYPHFESPRGQAVIQQAELALQHVKESGQTQ